MKRKKIYKFVLFLALFFSIERFCHWQTKGFRLCKASTAYVYSFPAKIQSPPPVFSQSFYFLDSGVQSYVFIGEDEETILKLYKHYHFGLTSDLLKKLLPEKIFYRIVKRREKRMNQLFKSATIAFQTLPTETALFYTHLNKTDHLLGKIQLIDKLGISHTLDLDQTEFILQKRAEPALQRLDRFFKEKKIEKAICSMKQVLSLIENRSKKGIKNKDGKILKNCGFLDQMAVEIDVSSYTLHKYSSNLYPHSKAKMKATLQILQWVKKNYFQYFQQCKEALLYENSF